MTEFSLALANLGHRIRRGHWPHWVRMEVQVTARRRIDQIECLNCDRRPGPGGRELLPMGVR